MDAWELAEIEARRVAGARLYEEFLSVPDLSVGLYVLEAGGDRPAVAAHRGRGLLRDRGACGRSPSARRTAASGRGRWSSSRPREPHRFHDITERLELLVAFGPAEGSRR